MMRFQIFFTLSEPTRVGVCDEHSHAIVEFPWERRTEAGDAVRFLNSVHQALWDMEVPADPILSQLISRLQSQAS